MHGGLDERHVPDTERSALVRIARVRLAQFSACRNGYVAALATLAEAALHDAIGAGVDANQLAAELDLSPQALTAILNRCPRLLDLHPTAGGIAP